MLKINLKIGKWWLEKHLEKMTLVLPQLPTLIKYHFYSYIQNLIFSETSRPFCCFFFLKSSLRYFIDDFDTMLISDLSSIEEHILLSEQVSSCKKILGRRDHEFTIPWCDQVVLVPHQNISLCFGLFGLRQVKVHLITIKISIIWCTDTFVKSKCSASKNLCFVAHNRNSM